MSLAACAAAYSLTDVLVSQTAAPTSAPSTSSALASVSASVTSSSTSVVSKTPASNGTATTTSPPLQVTNAAVQVALGGLPALALAACAFFAL